MYTTKLREDEEWAIKHMQAWGLCGSVDLLASRLCEARAQVEQEKRKFAAEQLRHAADVFGTQPWKQKWDDTESDWLRARAAELEKDGGQ